MNKQIILLTVLLATTLSVSAQISISTDGSSPDPSSMLDVKSTDKGMLVPRLTLNQIQSISNPAIGLQVFCITDGKMYFFVGTANQWKEVAYGTGTITPAAPCGDSITILHIAGDVAPVTKTVTYGTANNIPGETLKCWITSNLGADHQATAVNDATEESAGWYWQFNRKQGYQYITTRIPITTWITSINEDLNWQAVNDPCALELGSGWRIPTSSEWSNVDASGNWTNWSGPWESALKMHAAGMLELSNGGLSGRGSGAWYCSSSQADNSQSYLLDFNSVSCLVHYYDKAYGWACRCLKD
jgi:hypothetical protein